MVLIKHKGKEIEFPSEYTEITMGQYDEICNIFESHQSELMQWVEIISLLAGIPKEELDDWPLDAFLKITSKMFTRIPKDKEPKKVYIGDRVFLTPKSNSISVRQTAELEKIALGKYKFSNMISLLLEPEDGGESADVEDIKENMLSTFLPTLMKVVTTYSDTLIKSIQKAKDEVIPTA